MTKFHYMFLVLCITLIGVSCAKYDQQIEITDLQKTQTIILHKKTDQKDIVSMALHVYGKINGEAQLALMLNGKQYKTKIMKGNINFKWGGDWYADSMELRYEPHQPVNDGKIKIEYVFKTI